MAQGPVIARQALLGCCPLSKGMGHNKTDSDSSYINTTHTVTVAGKLFFWISSVTTLCNHFIYGVNTILVIVLFKKVL